MGQLKHLVRHPKSRYICNVMGAMQREPRNDDLAPLIVQKLSVRFFTWEQVKTLRASKNVPEKAMWVLKRKFGISVDTRHVAE